MRPADGGNEGPPVFVPLILAAGAGRRMGGPKALLELGGRTALERCLDACRRAAPRAGALGVPIVVCGHGAAEVRARHGAAAASVGGGDAAGGDAAAVGARFVDNPAPERGQTSSVQCGLAHLPAATAGCLIFPVDHPLAGAADVAALVEAAVTHTSALVVLPSHAGRAGHPALVRRQLLPEILELSPEDPLHRVLRAHREETAFVVRPGAGVITDVDTPADLEAARRLLKTRRTGDQRREHRHPRRHRAAGA